VFEELEKNRREVTMELRAECEAIFWLPDRSISNITSMVPNVLRTPACSNEGFLAYLRASVASVIIVVEINTRSASIDAFKCRCRRSKSDRLIRQGRPRSFTELSTVNRLVRKPELRQERLNPMRETEVHFFFGGSFRKRTRTLV